MNEDNDKRALIVAALLAIALLFLAPTGAISQETDPEEAPSTTPATEEHEQGRTDTAPAPTTGQGEARASQPSDDPFRPSETISEDLSVPFPVDI